MDRIEAAEMLLDERNRCEENCVSNCEMMKQALTMGAEALMKIEKLGMQTKERREREAKGCK